MFDMIPFRKNNMRGTSFSKFLDENFDDFFNSMNVFQDNFKADLKETEDSYLVEADLPGVKKDAINIEFNNNYLSISAKREDSIEDKRENYVRRERHYGEYKRSFYIDNVDESKIDASFADGVLKITLPKLDKDAPKKRRIEIK